MKKSGGKTEVVQKKTWKTPEVYVEEIATSTKAGIIAMGVEVGITYSIS